MAGSCSSQRQDVTAGDAFITSRTILIWGKHSDVTNESTQAESPLLPINWSTLIPSILTVAAPDLLDPKSAAHNSKPRLSFSAKPVLLNTPNDDDDDCDTHTTVMRWKTVSAIFFLVVLYLIIGAMVFKALEQPYESYEKLVILEKKLDFLVMHGCVNSSELEDLVKVGGSVKLVLFKSFLKHLTLCFYKYCILHRGERRG